MVKRRHHRSWSGLALGTVLVLMAGLSSVPVTLARQPDGDTRLLHLPMRWCVLEGTPAARHDPNGAVLERIRRASSILTPRAGITLRSAVNRSLAGSLGFPVIRDPRLRLGRAGDVRVPTESIGEYLLVVQRCEQAWQLLEGGDGAAEGGGGIARGPIAVIVGDFVDGRGRRVGSVWGYALSAATNPDYCRAADPVIRHASGGSLMVVDSSEGTPSALLDGRLVAHEVGHVLRLGHGDGLDGPGSVRGRIDKFCDDTEDPDIVPGSLMSRSLAFGSLESWQRRLARNVLERHPAALASEWSFRPQPERRRIWQLQRIANDGSRLVPRFVPPGRTPLRPLPGLGSAGLYGDWAPDDLRDVQGGSGALPGADLRGVSVGEDMADGAVEVAVSTGAGGKVVGEHVGVVGMDTDGDPKTGGSPGSLPRDPFPEWDEAVLMDFIARTRLEDGASTAEAWRWDEASGRWREVLPAPMVELGEVLSEGDHAAKVDGGSATRGESLVVTLPGDALELGDHIGVAAMLTTRTPDGEERVDTIPADPVASGLASMSLAAADYPVCAVNRDATRPGVVQAGTAAALEADGFGVDGQVTVWLDDGAEPVATASYHELPCDRAWVGEVSLPAATEPGLHVVQVVLGDTGLTAECPVLVGDGEAPDFDAP